MLPDQILNTYQNACSRLICLDYDGTLREFADLPAAAAPTSEIMALLQALSSDGNNTVILCSGRDYTDIDLWFRQLPLVLIAEHGLWTKQQNQPWAALAKTDNAWKVPLLALLQSYLQTVPASFVETKNTSLVWHYRQAADQVLAATKATELVVALSHFKQDFPDLQVMPGNKIVEIKLGSHNKGTCLKPWFDQDYHFVLVMGDDTTDEDMFKAAPANASTFTIKIGPGHSAARFHLADPVAARDLLAQLSRLSHASHQ